MGKFVLSVLVVFGGLCVAQGDSSLSGRSLSAATDSSVAAMPIRLEAGSTNVDPAATRTGSVVLETSPAGAAVMLDGEAVGTTPVTLSDIAEGTHRIELRKKGHYGKAVTVKVSAGKEVRAVFDLVRPGRLVITSAPDSADVHLKNSPVGVTPLVVDPAKPGEYHIGLARDGYAAFDTTVTVGDGMSDSLHIVLDRSAAYRDSVAALRAQRLGDQRRSKGLVSLGAFLAFSVLILVFELTR